MWSTVIVPKRLQVARFKQFCFKPVLKYQKNVSAERVWSPTEFQTVGAAAQNALMKLLSMKPVKI